MKGLSVNTIHESQLTPRHIHGETSNMEPSEILKTFREKNQVTQKLPGLRIAPQ